MGKVRFGLSNVHYSIYTPASGSTAASWATPVAMPGAVSLTLDASDDNSNFYADNQVWYTQGSSNGRTGTLEMAYIDDTVKTALLGYASVTGGDVVEMADPDFADFALLFQVSGNQEDKDYVFYLCQLGRPSLDAETTNDTNEPKTISLPVTVKVIKNSGGVRIIGKEHIDTGSEDTWFTAAPTLPTIA